VTKAIFHLDSRLVGEVNRVLDGKMQSTVWREIGRSVRKIKSQCGVEIVFREYDRQDKIMQKYRDVAVKIAKQRGQKAFKKREKQEMIQKAQERTEESKSIATGDDLGCVQNVRPYAKGSKNDSFSLVIREK